MGSYAHKKALKHVSAFIAVILKRY